MGCHWVSHVVTGPGVVGSNRLGERVLGLGSGISFEVETIDSMSDLKRQGLHA